MFEAKTVENILATSMPGTHPQLAGGGGWEGVGADRGRWGGRRVSLRRSPRPGGSGCGRRSPAAPAGSGDGAGGRAGGGGQQGQRTSAKAWTAAASKRVSSSSCVPSRSSTASTECSGRCGGGPRRRCWTRPPPPAARREGWEGGAAAASRRQQRPQRGVRGEKPGRRRSTAAMHTQSRPAQPTCPGQQGRPPTIAGGVAAQ